MWNVWCICYKPIWLYQNQSQFKIQCGCLSRISQNGIWIRETMKKHGDRFIRFKMAEWHGELYMYMCMWIVHMESLYIYPRFAGAAADEKIRMSI